MTAKYAKGRGEKSPLFCFMRELIEIDYIEHLKVGYIFKSNNNVKALLLVYKDNSTGIHVKSPLNISDIKYLVANTRKLMQRIDYIITAYCAEDNKEGNKLAKILGFEIVQCKARYNKYIYDPSITSKHTDIYSN